MTIEVLEDEVEFWAQMMVAAVMTRSYDDYRRARSILHTKTCDLFAIMETDHA